MKKKEMIEKIEDLEEDIKKLKEELGRGSYLGFYSHEIVSGKGLLGRYELLEKHLGVEYKTNESPRYVKKAGRPKKEKNATTEQGST